MVIATNLEITLFSSHLSIPLLTSAMEDFDSNTKTKSQISMVSSLKPLNDATLCNANSWVSLILNTLNLTGYSVGWSLISSALHLHWEHGLTYTEKI